jgi:hypothetical protein
MLNGGQNALRFRLIRDFDVLALVFNQLRFKGGRFVRAEERVDSPIFFGNKCPNFLLALND